MFPYSASKLWWIIFFKIHSLIKVSLGKLAQTVRTQPHFITCICKQLSPTLVYLSQSIIAVEKKKMSLGVISYHIHINLTSCGVVNAFNSASHISHFHRYIFLKPSFKKEKRKKQITTFFSLILKLLFLKE